jgi:uncharacterized protein
MGTVRAEGVTNAALRRFALSLRESLKAERVLLFGSRARGNARSDSDYDFIIVAPHFEGMGRRERPLGLHRLFYEAMGGRAPIDLFCMTPAEFDAARNRITLVAAVLPEAIDLLPSSPCVSEATDGGSRRPRLPEDDV